MFALFLVPVYPIFLASSSALAADATRSDQRAGGLGVLAGVFAFSVLTGSSLGGFVGDTLGLRAVILVAAAFSCLGFGAFVALVGFRRPAPKPEERIS
jgi:predicted MFS family arabinose efflux permease